ncbi:hypothetical protein DSI90_05985, partial [Mycobacterium tuberculosis]
MDDSLRFATGLRRVCDGPAAWEFPPPTIRHPAISALGAANSRCCAVHAERMHAIFGRLAGTH